MPHTRVIRLMFNLLAITNTPNLFTLLQFRFRQRAIAGGVLMGLLDRYCFVVLLSLAVAVAIKAVGVLLVNAFLVIPASCAKLLSYHFTRFLTLSVFLRAISSSWDDSIGVI